MNTHRVGRLARACFVLGVFSLVEGQPVWADDGTQNRLPASMGALGDSMTRAAMAPYKRTESFFPWIDMQLLASVMLWKSSGNIRDIEHPKYSWTTGSSKLTREMPSHLRRLMAIEGQKIPYYNAALSGDESADVWSHQIGELRDWSESNIHQEFPDYVTMLIGANDLCAESTAGMVQTTDYYANVFKVVDEMVRTSPKTQVLITTIPNVVKLRDVAATSNDFGVAKCEDVWKEIKLCPTLTTLTDDVSRAALQSRMLQYNEALKDVVSKERVQYGDRVRYTDRLYQEVFDSTELAVDCFHPNIDGQARISEVTFRDSWWNDQWVQKRAEIKQDFLDEQQANCRPFDDKGAYRPEICYEKWTDPK